MKKLHKKIGAVALASMIVAGGFGASKVDSHAWWWSSKSSVVIDHNSWDLKKLSEGARHDYNYLEYYLNEISKDGIKIFAVSENKDAMNKYINKKFGEKPEIANRLLQVPNKSFYGEEFVNIFNLKYNYSMKQDVKSSIVHLQFGDIYVLAYKI